VQIDGVLEGVAEKMGYEEIVGRIMAYSLFVPVFLMSYDVKNIERLTQNLISSYRQLPPKSHLPFVNGAIKSNNFCSLMHVYKILRVRFDTSYHKMYHEETPYSHRRVLSLVFIINFPGHVISRPATSGIICIACKRPRSQKVQLPCITRMKHVSVPGYQVERRGKSNSEAIVKIPSLDGFRACRTENG